MISDRMGEEVGRVGRVSESDHQLCAAEVRFRFVAHQFTLGNEAALEVARDFEDGDRTSRHEAADAYTDTRFEVGVQFIAFNHVERDGAMGKSHGAVLGVDARRIGLETADADQGVDDSHRE